MEAVILKGYPLTHKNHPRHTKQDEKGKKNLPREQIKKGNMFSHRAKREESIRDPEEAREAIQMERRDKSAGR